MAPDFPLLQLGANLAPEDVHAGYVFGIDIFLVPFLEHLIELCGLDAVLRQLAVHQALIHEHLHVVLIHTVLLGGLRDRRRGDQPFCPVEQTATDQPG